MEETRIFSVNSGLQFQRDDETGDVTIVVEGMNVRVDVHSWISAVAEMTCHGGQVNHEEFKMMHTGIGGAV